MATQTYTDGVTLSAAAELNRFDTIAYSVLSGVAGTNTITATGPANYTYLATRPPVWFIPAVTNTGATTINITPSGSSALGARNVFANGAACVGGELIAGVPACLVDDGTRFHIVGSLFPRFIVGTFSRNIALAGSNQAVTGVGFQPKAVIFFALVNGTSAFSVGMTISSASAAIFDDSVDAAGTYANAAVLIQLATAAATSGVASLATLDSDGFTVTWTKNGAPVGTATIFYLAFR